MDIFIDMYCKNSGDVLTVYVYGQRIKETMYISACMTPVIIQYCMVEKSLKGLH